MQHGREGALPGFLFENPRRVGVGIARMDHERQAGLARRGDMGAKAALLRVARAAVVVVVEPGFADARRPLGCARARDKIGRGDVRFLVRVMRMRADRAIDVGKALGDREQLGVPLQRASRS